MSQTPLLLLTNDDGVSAPGIRVLREALAPLGRVVVVAPATEQSGTSHAITIDRPLRHVEHAPDVHSIDGTPADCIYLALFENRFLPRRPDLVVSGINHGSNVGTSVHYSGTVAGAREAALRGIHAIAFSHDGGRPAESTWVATLAHDMVERLLRAQKPAGNPLLLNVNFPRQAPKGIRITRVGRQIYEEQVVPRRDPAGREYFWIGGRVTDYGEVSGSDKQAVDDGYVAVTPLAIEPTWAAHFGVAAQVAGPEAISLVTEVTQNSGTTDR